MEYLIRKINMIDIMGMLIPGGLLLLILEQDIKCLAYLTIALGNIGADKLIWCVIFLCGSYLVGMLLHELGSIMEKLLWKNPLTNPRIYAALTTEMFKTYHSVDTLDEIVGKLIQKNLLNDPKEWTEVLTEAVQMYHLEQKYNMPPESESLVQRTDDPSGCTEKKHSRKKCVTIFFVFLFRISRYVIKAVISLFPAMAVVCLAFGCSFSQFLVGAAVSLLVIALCQPKYSKMLWTIWGPTVSKDKRKENWEKLQDIISNDLDISSHSDTSEENARKRGLFDGYRALARSTLVMLAILQCYVLTCGGNGSLAHVVGEFSSNPAFYYLRVMLVVALIMRYWHYSCTKYTYCYNGYIHNQSIPPKSDK